jgi:putative membrane protein
MGIRQNFKSTGQVLIAALVTAALGGCATSREQPPVNANANVAATPAAAQPLAHEAKAKPAVNRGASSPLASSKNSSAAILAQIHRADLSEITIGKIAEGKATTSEVRAYADQLVTDQTNVDQMVVAVAQKTGARLHEAAAAPRAGRHKSAQGKLVEQKLSSASGAGFDRLFLQQTSSDHEKLISTLQREREDASNDEVEALIDKIIPVLEQHRDLAKILMKKEQA